MGGVPSVTLPMRGVPRNDSFRLVSEVPRALSTASLSPVAWVASLHRPCAGAAWQEERSTTQFKVRVVQIPCNDAPAGSAEEMSIEEVED